MREVVTLAGVAALEDDSLDGDERVIIEQRHLEAALEQVGKPAKKERIGFSPRAE